MTANGGEALDVALGLLRAPARRGVLRARPLPDGVGEVLAIASGSVEGARSAASRTGYTEAELVDAARFYVQQVLLAEDADAYRVLGAARDAGHGTLRDHHRLLLRWLHPDRSDADAQWDSALSARVNQAWNHLRTDAARAQYDAGLASEPADHPAAAMAVMPASPYAANAAMAPPAGPRFSAAPVAVALLGLACVVLAWLAFNREDVLQDMRSGAMPTAPQRATAGELEVDAVQPLQRLQGMTVVAPAFGASEPLPRLAASVEMPAPAAAVESSPQAAADAQSPARSRTHSQTQTQAQVATALSPGSSGQPAHGGATATLAWADEVSPDVDASQHHANPATHARQGAEAAAPVRARETAGENVPAALDADPLQLFREAEETVRGLTAYLIADGGTEPAWLDMPTRLEAAGIRARLQARHEGRAPSRMELDTPDWTLGSHAASMRGAYRLGGRRGLAETGVLRVDLARLEHQWRVAALQLEPAQ